MASAERLLRYGLKNKVYSIQNGRTPYIRLSCIRRNHWQYELSVETRRDMRLGMRYAHRRHFRMRVQPLRDALQRRTRPSSREIAAWLVKKQQARRLDERGVQLRLHRLAEHRLAFCGHHPDMATKICEHYAGFPSPFTEKTDVKCV